VSYLPNHYPPPIASSPSMPTHDCKHAGWGRRKQKKKSWNAGCSHRRGARLTVIRLFIALFTHWVDDSPPHLSDTSWCFLLFSSFADPFKGAFRPALSILLHDMGNCFAASRLQEEEDNVAETFCHDPTGVRSSPFSAHLCTCRLRGIANPCVEAFLSNGFISEAAFLKAMESTTRHAIRCTFWLLMRTGHPTCSWRDMCVEMASCG
jgi:hypothetical protein